MSGHPRACGEQIDHSVYYPSHYGSSPRVRGTGRQTDQLGGEYRVIPARAGNSSSVSSRTSPSTGHPRACGEQHACPMCKPSWSGSSPRVRGTGQPMPSGHRRSRVIPARAGNSASGTPTTTSPSGHPRACGEQFVAAPTVTPLPGSSPRVRGTVGSGPQGPPRRRVIPARAGNREGPPSKRWRKAGHPRACGEQGFHPHSASSYSGSSPRVRGTAQLAGAAAKSRRVIPARAGNRHHYILFFFSYFRIFKEPTKIFTW